MGSLSKGTSYYPTSHHQSMLQQIIDGSNAENRLVRSYNRSFNGFAAILNDQQREKLIGMRGVVSVFQCQNYHLKTTRSWDFLGFPQSIKRDKLLESGLVVGVIDSGIWPESKSFTDKDLFSMIDQALVPFQKKWRGVCAGGGNFTCNKKIIGARSYGSDQSARDYGGHGTHTASTASGREVEGVSFYDLAKGTARGGVPSSKIVVYKVCDKDGNCSGKDILAAFDDAIADGVDIITISIGSQIAVEFLKDPIAIGSFHAMEKGILTVQAAGNSGPKPSSVSSVAPWLFSIAATTVDRQFIDKLILGNGKTFIGKSINIVPSNGTKFPIVVCNAQACPRGYGSPEMCECIDKNMVNGKLVLCGTPGGEVLAYANGAIGSILNVTHSKNDAPQVSLKPTLNLDTKDYVLVQSYTNSTKYPVAEILKSEIFHDNNAPTVASFSSRGPNPLVLEIMKPDISAPGVDILAAYSPLAPPSDDINDKRQVKYSIESGTSMACPHVAGVVAYVKSFHPDWSPASIKSAIMTTAKPVNGTYNDLAGEFAYGSGNVNPKQAVDPGLVYDITKEDYVRMLCNYGYDANKIKQISGENSSCHGASNRSFVKDINYPALVIPVESHKNFNVKIHRTVTNVGSPNSSYTATVIPIQNIKISVEPKILSFRSLNEKQSFVVTVVGGAESKQMVSSSSLVWSDGTHRVKSPIIVQRLS
ncbi:subtilisin-like serine protease [Medicago truncatula]|uniref:Subtilisin-like serine protease n=1 Tax=Medicago truncatula TaxID=3880 RepID=G7LAQ8_MEDTR|nr:subtilisin-like serine protease [Medicago truncatula]